MSVNRAILLGRLTHDPEVKQTQGGTSVANFTLALNERWTDKSGEKKESCEFLKIVVWGRLSELCGQYLHKGSQVFVEGKIQTRQWQDKDGQTRFTTEVQAHSIQFLDSREKIQPEESLPF